MNHTFIELIIFMGMIWGMASLLWLFNYLDDRQTYKHMEKEKNCNKK